MADWCVVSKTGQVVFCFSFTGEGKPDLKVYYEHPELYNAVLERDTPPSAVEVYRKHWCKSP